VSAAGVIASTSPPLGSFAWLSTGACIAPDGTDRHHLVTVTPGVPLHGEPAHYGKDHRPGCSCAPRKGAHLAPLVTNTPVVGRSGFSDPLPVPNTITVRGHGPALITRRLAQCAAGSEPSQPRADLIWWSAAFPAAQAQRPGPPVHHLLTHRAQASRQPRQSPARSAPAQSRPDSCGRLCAATMSLEDGPTPHDRRPRRRCEWLRRC
jgi:hypothetical protein